MPKATVSEVDSRISIVPMKTEGISGYDVDNAYPQRVENIINSSGTGKSVTKMLAKYIFGGGFEDKEFYKKVVNKKGLTADKLLRKVTRSVSKFDGVAIHFNYNLNYKKSETNIVPFKHCRKVSEENEEHPNTIAVYDDWGRDRKKQIDRDKIDYINLYNPDPNVIQEQVIAAGGWSKYKGQILYWSVEEGEYPLAPGDAVLEDMQTDSKAKTFKYRGITTNFMASHVLEIDAFQTSEEGGTSDDQKLQFMQTLADFQGGDDALKVLLLERQPGSEPFQMTKVDIQKVDDLYKYTEESAQNNIIRHYLIPPVLIMAIPGKLGSNKEMNEASQQYNAITSEYRLMLEELFILIFEEFYYDINPVKNYKIIPLTEELREAIPVDFFKDTTKNERRKSIGLPEEVEAAATTVTLAEKIGVGGVTAFTNILVDPVLTKEQKIQSLVLIFGITKAEATAAVTGEEATV